MKTFVEELVYGDYKDIELDGKYLKGFARAVEGGQPVVNAELLLMTDDSGEKTKFRLFYAANEPMTEYAFFQLHKYTHNSENLVDIIPFTYIRDEITKTGIIIVKKFEEKEQTSNLEKQFK